MEKINPNMPTGDFDREDTIIIFNNGYFKSGLLGWGIYKINNYYGFKSPNIDLYYYCYGKTVVRGFIEHDIFFNIKLCFGLDNFYYYEKISGDVNYFKGFRNK